MPLYDYSCPECLRKTEIILTLTELNDPLFTGVICLHCGSHMIKLLSKPARIIVRNNKPNKRRYEG